MAQDTSIGANGEWLKWMAERRYCLEIMVIEGVTGIALVRGDLLEDGTGVKKITVTAATGANCNAILMEPVSAAENTADCSRLCMVRGPAVIDSDKVVMSTSETQKAAALTALAALDIRAANSALAEYVTQTS